MKNIEGEKVTVTREYLDFLLKENKLLEERLKSIQMGDTLQTDILLRQIERLTKDGKIDKMTNVFNSNYIEDDDVRAELEALSKAGISFGIVFVDMDNLKEINDTQGHSSGDEAIILLATTLVEAVSSRDVVIRKGGDEFIVILNHLSSDDSDGVSERVLDQIKESFLENGIMSSLGFAMSFECNHNIGDTINLADQRMYEEKSKRKEN